MTRIFPALALVLLILAGTASALRAQDIAAADYARVNAALVEHHALPRYERLATATNAFAAEAEVFCAGPSDDGRARLREGFHEAMDAWMGVQHLRFGPVDLLMRGYRFYFWPQARGKVADAVADIVAAGEDDSALAARIGRANVAVQGLLAVEVLLYDERYLGAHASDARPGEFLASSGQGGVVVIDATSGMARPFSVTRLQNGRWDNHLVAVTVT